MLANPCKDCTERYLGCHDKCQSYIKWKEEYRKLKEIDYINNQDIGLQVLQEYIIRRKRRHKR